MRQRTSISISILVVLLASLAVIWLGGRPGSNAAEPASFPLRRDLQEAPPTFHAAVRPIPATQIHIKGRVIDDRGRPIEGASISAQLLIPPGNTSTSPPAPLGQPEPLWSDANGAFDFVLPELEIEVIIAASGENYSHAIKHIELHNESIEGIEIVLRAFGSISGRVVDLRHRPIQFMMIEARSTGQSLAVRRASRIPTGQDGAFAISGLGAAEYALYARYRPPSGKRNWMGGIPVETAGIVGGAGPLTTVKLAEAESVQGIELVVPWDADRVIEGRIVDEKQDPIAGAVAWAESPGGSSPLGVCVTPTDVDGRFRIDYVRDTANSMDMNLVTVRGQAEGFERGLAEQVAVGTKNAKVVLLRAKRGAITGRVIDASTRNPVSTAKVMLERVACEWGEDWASPNYLNPHHDAGVSSRGKFAIENVPAGTASLKVYAPGYGLSTIEKVVVRSGEETEVEIPLLVGGTLVVNIRPVGALEGKLFHDFSLDCWPVDRVGDWSIATSYKAHEAIRGNPISPKAEKPGTRTITLPPGHYAVTALVVPMLPEDPMLVPATHFAYDEAIVESGETTTLELNVGGGGEVSGYLAPQQGETVTVSLAPGREVSAILEDSTTAFGNAATMGSYFQKRMRRPGPFLFFGVPEGSYTAILTATSMRDPTPYVRTTKAIELKDGDAITLSFLER